MQVVGWPRHLRSTNITSRSFDYHYHASRSASSFISFSGINIPYQSITSRQSSIFQRLRQLQSGYGKHNNNNKCDHPLSATTVLIEGRTLIHQIWSTTGHRGNHCHTNRTSNNNKSSWILKNLIMTTAAIERERQQYQNTGSSSSDILNYLIQQQHQIYRDRDQDRSRLTISHLNDNDHIINRSDHYHYHLPSLIIITTELFSSLSPHSHVNLSSASSGYLAEFTIPIHHMSIIPQSHYHTVICDTISDPGNMGSIIRTCFALGWKQIILKGGANPYTHKVIASSAGYIAHPDLHITYYTDTNNHNDQSLDQPYYHSDVLLQLIDSYQQKKMIYLCGLVVREGSTPETILHDYHRQQQEYHGHHINNSRSLWLVIGNESHGLSSSILSRCKSLCQLPLESNVESLNAAAAAAIACYALRPPVLKYHKTNP